MSDLTKHTLTINISDRIEWIDNRCGLTEIQKDYVTAQTKEAVNEAVQQANEANKQPDIEALRLQSVVCSALSDEIATKMLAHCPYEKSGWCKTELGCRFKLECGRNKGNGCELAL